jgi:DNA recombination protein RmuC
MQGSIPVEFLTTETLLMTGGILWLVVVVLLIVLILRPTVPNLLSIHSRLDAIEKLQERAERGAKDEIVANRQESVEQARGLREELQLSLRNSTDSLVRGVDMISAAQQQRLEDFANRLSALKQAGDLSAVQLRQELSSALNLFKESQDKRLTESATQLQQHFESFGRRLTDFGQTGQENSKLTRVELSTALKDFKESLQRQMSDIVGLQKLQFDSFATQLTRLTESNEKKADELRIAVDFKLKELQADNTSKLEEMRKTVDEKLQGTLDKRLGESFKQVSDRLEQVHLGLGEMKNLASGVGDLKRVLTNVKTRGTWGEVQLGNLLEQILTSEQYAKNVCTKPSGRETVEFALKLPGPDDRDGKSVWLPIDAKFPKEDYERLVDASERGDSEAVDQAAKNLESRIRSQARDIRDKYVSPPHTTDFGLLYLPTEGLYAEVLRRPGLVDSIQKEMRVIVSGPTTLAALLNSLQMGFRTLAIQKRSSEVWRVLGAVKTDFSKFGDLLDKVKKKLDETSNTIDDAANRSRLLERKLRKVEALQAPEAEKVLDNVPSLDGDADPSIDQE